MENKALAKADKRITYVAGGEEVILSRQIVRDYLTKGNGNVSDQDLTQFISICKYQQLNPFLNEAYLIKFGTQPAQIIVSKEAFMKRAESHESYEGIKAGLILLRNGELKEVEGGFYLQDDEILGAWAEVYRKDRKFPIVAKVPLAEYDKKQSTWNEKKGTMITKVAKVQALREAFPSQLGALYTNDESNVIDIEADEVKTQREVVDTEVIVQNEPTEVATPTAEETGELNFNDV